jgi:hypothetical protein
MPLGFFSNDTTANAIMQSHIWTFTDFLKIYIMHNCIFTDDKSESPFHSNQINQIMHFFQYSTSIFSNPNLI